ncbi:MAG: MBL fold metallo-hydrolase [Thermodesulfobacteriota bacterium]
MRVRFWGVRGSIPCPGPTTVRYGGNTPCLELRLPDRDRLVIIDAGSGLRELGNALLGRDLARGPLVTQLFLTHTHWDHIMGFPFFVPIYIPGTRLTVYGPATYEDESLADIVGGQLTYRYFPVRQTDLAANIQYVHLREGRYDLGEGLVVSTKYLNHPVLCLGYRFEYRGLTLCTAYDTEPFANVFCTDPGDPAFDEAIAEEGARAAAEENARVEAFFAGADLLIYDAQYTREEYQASKRGWGHSPMDHAVAAARRAGVRRLALFHHEPLRTDDQLDAQAAIHASGPDDPGPEIFFAREGTEIDLATGS